MTFIEIHNLGKWLKKFRLLKTINNTKFMGVISFYSENNPVFTIEVNKLNEHGNNVVAINGKEIINFSIGQKGCQIMGKILKILFFADIRLIGINEL
ncbi:hypothetical protein [Pectinatus frisingensis]|uniref:hypothetical protein n=1 Tax=Pectinatus frisingensis TaxID=865 RepID=UPI0018C7FD27|nr:hypothetical protein [Pectinatus frisingensis]